MPLSLLVLEVPNTRHARPAPTSETTKEVRRLAAPVDSGDSLQPIFGRRGPVALAEIRPTPPLDGPRYAIQLQLDLVVKPKERPGPVPQLEFRCYKPTFGRAFSNRE